MNLFCTILVLIVSLSSILAYECGVSSSHVPIRPLIVNSKMPGDWPWIVSVYGNEELICTGFIISSKFVLTAAHCIIIYRLDHPKDDDNFSIHAGAVNASEGEVIRVKKITTFDQSHSKHIPNDIAVLELERRLKFNENISSICLPKNYQEFSDEIAFLAGFGHVWHKDLVRKDEENFILNEVSISFKNFDYCKSASEEMNYTSTKYICGGAKNKGSAKGDSGAPLMVQQKTMLGNKLKSRWFSVGVVALGGYHYVNNQDPNKWSINVFTRVTHYCKWIKKVTNGDAFCIDTYNSENDANISPNGTDIIQKLDQEGYLESPDQNAESEEEEKKEKEEEEEDLPNQDVSLPSQGTEVDPKNMSPQFIQRLPKLSQLTLGSGANSRTRDVAQRSPNILSTKVNQRRRKGKKAAKSGLQSTKRKRGSATKRKRGTSKRSSSVGKKRRKTASTRARRQKIGSTRARHQKIGSTRARRQKKS